VTTPADTSVTALTDIVSGDSCDTETTDGRPFDNGSSAFNKYGALFTKTPVKLSRLAAYTPQGIATWLNWDGGKDDLNDDLLLVTA